MVTSCPCPQSWARSHERQPYSANPGDTPTLVPRLTRMKMRVLESPTRYFPSDTLTMEN